MKNFILQEKVIKSFSQQCRNRNKFKFQEEKTLGVGGWGVVTYFLSKRQDKSTLAGFMCLVCWVTNTKKLLIFLLFFHCLNSCIVLFCSVHSRFDLNPVIKHFSTRRPGGRHISSLLAPLCRLECNVVHN